MRIRAPLNRADYRVMLMDRLRNDFMRACDLGLVGIYIPHIVTVTWKRGTKLTRKRARATGSKIKEGYNTRTDIECQSVELLRIY